MVLAVVRSSVIETRAMLILSILLLALTALYAIGFSLYRYRTVFNPIAVYSVLHIGGFTLLSGAIAYHNIEAAQYSEQAITRVHLAALAVFVGFLWPFHARGPLVVAFYRFLVTALGFSSKTDAARFRLGKFLGLLVGALASFAALAVVGGGGTMWLTDSRTAYIQYRAGAGLFYAATQWGLVLALLYYLWSQRPQKTYRVAMIVLLFCCAGYFTGSKGNVMMLVMSGAIYYNFYVRRISVTNTILLTLALFVTFLCLIVAQGTGENLIESLQYFRDYVNTTAIFMSQVDDWGYRHGSVNLSELWYYVPRGLFPQKPFEYGILLIHERLYPGAAAAGNTPGILLWAGFYWDFGMAGVFLLGWVMGSFQRAAYEYYLRNKERFFPFLLMIQFSLFLILPFATPLLTIVLLGSVLLFFRLRFITATGIRSESRV
jgi:oligosaccharide repeat unit polymerase